MNEQAIVCPHCGSGNVIKYGIYEGIQRYYCNVGSLPLWLRHKGRGLLSGGWWQNNPFRDLPWQAVVLLVLGAVLEAVGLISLVSLLPVSDESKWRILLGLGVGLIVAGYFFFRSRSKPKNKQIPPATITPITHCGDSCKGSDSIGRKSCHIPNIPRKAFIISNAPIIHKIPPTKLPICLLCLGILFPLHRQLNIRISHMSTIMGNALARYACDCYPLRYGYKGHLLRSQKGKTKSG